MKLSQAIWTTLRTWARRESPAHEIPVRADLADDSWDNVRIADARVQAIVEQEVGNAMRRVPRPKRFAHGTQPPALPDYDCHPGGALQSSSTTNDTAVTAVVDDVDAGWDRLLKEVP